MTFWDGVLWFALVLGLASLVAEVLGLRRPNGPWANVARHTTTGLAGILAAAFLFLCLLFLSLQVNVEYVWTYTATWVTWPYRLAGAWTGREGSLLLWTAAMATTAAVVSQAHARSRRSTDPAHAWTRVVMLALLALFLLAVARQGTFGPTPEYLLTGRPGGNGINPTLRSPFILIHPPLMFVAYALTIVPAAAAIAHLITGTNAWSRIAGRATKLDWIVYTFAMGLGGMWAYFTLGFGGYWAWDPVEVANLLPWLALTIYVHAQMMHARRGDFHDVGPMLGVLPFVFTVFSTVSTRSGLWVSVHAFTDPTNAFNPDAAGRLLGILGLDASLVPYFGIILGTLLVSLALWCRRLAIDHGTLPRWSKIIAGALGAAGALAFLAPTALLGLAFEIGAFTGSVGLGALALLVLAVLAGAAPMLAAEPPTADRMKWVSVRGLAMVSVLLLSLALVVSVLWHFGAVNGWSEAFWDARIPWVLTPIALALTVLLLHAQYGRVPALQVAGAGLVAGVIGFLIGGLGAYAMVLSTVTFGAGVDKMVHVGFVGSRTAKAGSTLLWLGALLNVIFWLNPPASVLFGAVAPRWPIQLPMGALALVGLVGAHMVGAGKAARWPYVLIGLLGAFFVAPLFAAAAFILHRRDAVPTKRLTRARIRVIGVYGVHLIVGLLFVGYSASTYYEEKIQGEYDIGDVIQVGTQDIQVASILADEGNPVDTFRIAVTSDFDDTARRTAEAQLHYEPSAGAYFPLPAALRAWHGDVYVQVDAICWETAAECSPDGWVTAYEPTFPESNQGSAQSARLTVHSLPGIGLIWGALALFVAYGLPIALIRDPAILPTAKAEDAA